MKITIAVLALALGALLAGCNSATQLNQMRVGMTKQDVISLLGTPDGTAAQANVEYLTYYLVSDSGYGRDQPYFVRLVDGRVESFGRFAQLSDLYMRPVTNARPGDANFPASPLGTTVVTGSSSGTDLAGELQKLEQLKEQGVLTEQEFEQAKAKLLSDQK